VQVSVSNTFRKRIQSAMRELAASASTQELTLCLWALAVGRTGVAAACSETDNLVRALLNRVAARDGLSDKSLDQVRVLPTLACLPASQMRRLGVCMCVCLCVAKMVMGTRLLAVLTIIW
jgi:hypothetical protein